jgi:hypothetical protein
MKFDRAALIRRGRSFAYWLRPDGTLVWQLAGMVEIIPPLAPYRPRRRRKHERLPGCGQS